ncbi:L,D-transpeptidase family protein [Sphingosinicella rhizophila]|uniref:L,D-transpeptidase family protein n=1 Tax=Sphingosinicella rhizophila TaxID=3050082 RepID=A0ABU3Q4C7_9SPHN|nr:L,D-transpeptidase family protein [Sphingosinicella sp. GR2756]MDT9598269.1 L,D-transpeptidase family protein [Sphingosinicella sp. GR2756]
MRTTFRLSTFGLLLAASAMPAGAQLKPGERPTELQIQAGEAPATPIDESEKALRALQNSVATTNWTRTAAGDLLAFVERIGEEGLDPADYQPDRLRAALDGIDEEQLRIAATDTFLRVSSDLALGHARGDTRVDWHMVDTDLDGNQQYALMRQAVENDSVEDTLRSLLPTHPQYAELKSVLSNTTDAATRNKIRTNLDRWRWLPRDLGPRYVIVNVPAFTVALVENGQVVTRHKAVVGAVKTATPQLSAVATGVILNPWWEVPASIAPEVRGKKGYVKVDTGNGGVRYRQPPGPGNALGRMKVVMPNNYAIYLHDTPSKAHFSRTARALSHGCIRTQDPLTFIRLLLDNPEWDKEAIDKAVAAGKTVKAEAVTPTPVYIAYFTAAAEANSGKILTYSDVYARDSKVVAALTDRSEKTALASAD